MGIDRERIIVAHRPDGTEITIPVVTVTGTRPGPSLMVVGCTHGDEQEGPAALHALVRAVDPAQLSGTLIAVPVLNGPAYEQRRRGNGLDDWYYDINRLFPGSRQGSLTQRIAAVFTEQLLPRADMVIALHSGGSNIFCCERAIIAGGNPEHLRLAQAMGPDWNLIAVGAGERKVVAHLTAASEQQGKPSMTLEFGGISARMPGEWRRQIQIYVHGLFNLMRCYRMLPDEPQYPSEWLLGEYEPLRAEDAGLFEWEPAMELRRVVAKNELLARIVDVFGDTLAEVRAPFEGMLVAIPSNATVMTAGAQIGSLLRVQQRLTRRD